MDKNKTYCCSLYGDKRTYLNKMFDDFDKAKAEGLKVLKEFNENINNPNYIPDQNIFAEELVELMDSCNHSEIISLSTIKEFWIVEFEKPEIPQNCGEWIVEIIDEDYWNNIYFLNEKYSLAKSLGDEKIKELNNLIYNFLDKKTEDYEYSLMLESYIVGVD